MAAVAKAYFQRYTISHIELAMQPGVVYTADRVCNLTLKFEPGYQVQFKLLGKQALLGEKVTGFASGGEAITTGAASAA